MQYKENEEMDELNEKAVVKIDASGDVVKCAKSLPAGECGYKAGAKVCGACGAMAVTQKDDVADEADISTTDTSMDDVELKRRPTGIESAHSKGQEEDMMEDVNPEDEMVDEETDKGSKLKPTKHSRRRAVSAMGMKSAEVDDDAFICQLERKVYPGVSEICEGCTGGCKSEAGMPGLLDVEGAALDIIDGKVLDSGYDFEEDQFVVQLQAKTGKFYEFLADGDTGEIWSFERIEMPEQVIAEKSLDGADEGFSVIGPDDAIEVAVKSLEAELDTSGDVISAESDIFLGHDVYAVQIDALNGKSYDVFVTLDGQFLGLDEWSADEAEEIEAEAAEIALKRAYSEESRMQLAERGIAMADGSYPIKDIADLQNAIRAFGRSKDKPATRAHIMKRARALGAENMIPENWMQKSDQFSETEILDAEIELKRAYAEDARSEMAKAGEAMPDGSFPIKDKTDLMNAIRSWGRAKDKEAAKAHIMKRAMDLGAEDMIPTDWVPQDVQDKFKKGEKSEDAAFIASLMEFELLAQEHDVNKF